MMMVMVLWKNFDDDYNAIDSGNDDQSVSQQPKKKSKKWDQNFLKEV